MKTENLLIRMTEYYAGDPAKIQHFIKVYSFARLIGSKEGLDAKTQGILETAAIVHDIGIKAAMEKYNDGSGRYQEIEGPPIAEQMLQSLDYPADWIERVCYLVGHHHTYHSIDGMDYQILVEADFLVNLFEGSSKKPEIERTLERIFKTETGSMLLRTMFLAQE